MKKLISIFSILLIMEANAIASDLEAARQKADRIFGKSLIGLHDARGALCSQLDLRPYAASTKLFPASEFPVAKATQKNVIHIEIKSNHILYKIGDGGLLNKPSYFWVYEAYLHFNDHTWLLHELPRDPSDLKDAEALEFTYNGLNLWLPEAMNNNILGILKEGIHLYECHSFQYKAAQNFEFAEKMEVVFDRSLIEELGIYMKPNSGSSNWIHSIPMIKPTDEFLPMNLSRANPGAYFYFGHGHFGNAHSAIEIGPDLILSKLGSAGLTVAPIKSLAYNYAGTLMIKEIKGENHLARSGQSATNVEEARFLKLTEHFRNNFYNIKALDEYERKNAMLSFTNPEYVAVKTEYMGLWRPGYEISAHEKFQFWLLDKFRESDNYEQFIERHQTALKRYLRIAPTEREWFDREPLY